ncbi:hypothetical protein [Engelhardtia mirabilis]|uniref:Uncharacterized protein n=1 Tax=Engelhardtia mirabilis TaxID=2528011 RepID=A0A518BFA4_9BACT|nr:hypothetical protein Pla133_07300 [Planctomycetes bacterium Pla133]QDU99990.1 hypothetical protein Pla86_07290 [Planctomycetes bacterium Pla86]
MRILAVFFLVYGTVVAVSWLYRQHNAFDMASALEAPAQPLPWSFDTDRGDVVFVELIDAQGRSTVVGRDGSGGWSGSFARGHYRLRLLDAQGELLEETTVDMAPAEPVEGQPRSVDAP